MNNAMAGNLKLCGQRPPASTNLKFQISNDSYHCYTTPKLITMKPIVLASRSPRRKQLLEWANISFDVIARETEESYPATLSLQEVPVYIARNKAIAVQRSDTFERYEKGNTILAADTIVVLDDEIIGKPSDREHAINILSKLSGRTHVVITGVVILTPNDEISFFEETSVSFYELNIDEIGYYVDEYKPYDKAGAYAIQEWIGVTGIKSITGDFYNVMGLPVSRVVKILSNL
jgi:septum formation protein